MIAVPELTQLAVWIEATGTDDVIHPEVTVYLKLKGGTTASQP